MRLERLIVSLKTYLGDAVMALPMIETLEREYEDVTIQTSPLVQELLQDPIRSRKFIPFEKSRKPWVTLKAAMRLKREGYDTVVLVNRSFRAALLAKIAGIPCRVGHDIEGRGWMLNKAVPYDDRRFEAETCMDLARALGCEGLARPRISITEPLRVEGNRLIEGCDVGIQAGARFGAKQIPLAVMAEVVCSLVQDGRRVVLLGGPDEVSATQEVQRMLPSPVLSLAGKTNIPATLATLANLRLCIGGDTGLMHMAAAVGTPTLTIFGPTNFDKWAHQYEPHRAIVAPENDMSKLRAGEVVGLVRDMLRG